MTFLCSLIFIIIIHELGHLWAAKLCKCGVKIFSVGFCRPLFQFNIGKTIYQFSPILLGGYCQLQGELEYSRSKYAFTNKTYLQKVFISLAGIAMNVISGLISYGLFLVTNNLIYLMFAYYSAIIGLSNLLPVPGLDGSYPIAFLFEKKWGKKKTYIILSAIFKKWMLWIMILNFMCIPYLIWMIISGQIL